jgi:hypothetical protein
MSNRKSRRGEKKSQKQSGVQGKRPEDKSPKQRKQAEYQQEHRPKPDKHGGSGAGRQQGGSGGGRERG